MMWPTLGHSLKKKASMERSSITASPKSRSASLGSPNGNGIQPGQSSINRPAKTSQLAPSVAKGIFETRHVHVSTLSNSMPVSPSLVRSFPGKVVGPRALPTFYSTSDGRGGLRSLSSSSMSRRSAFSNSKPASIHVEQWDTMTRVTDHNFNYENVFDSLLKATVDIEEESEPVTPATTATAEPRPLTQTHLDRQASITSLSSSRDTQSASSIKTGSNEDKEVEKVTLKVLTDRIEGLESEKNALVAQVTCLQQQNQELLELFELKLKADIKKASPRSYYKTRTISIKRSNRMSRGNDLGESRSLSSRDQDHPDEKENQASVGSRSDSELQNQLSWERHSESTTERGKNQLSSPIKPLPLTPSYSLASTN
jgi:hypothetical protein